MNETQKDGRSTYGSPAPLSREQMQQQMQAAFQDGSNRPRKKKQPEQRRISDMPNGKPAQRGKRGNQPEPMPRSVGQATANFGKSKRPLPLLRRGFIMKKRHLQPQLKHIAMCIAAAVHRHPFRHGTIETLVRKNRNIMAVQMWHLPEKAERLLVL